MCVERPIQSSIVIFASSGFLFLLCYLLIPWPLFTGSREPFRSTLPTHKRVPWTGSSFSFLYPWRAIPILPPQLRKQIVVVASGICLIVEAFHLTLSNRKCFALGSRGFLVCEYLSVYSSTNTDGFKGFVPFALVCFHSVRRQNEAGQTDINGSKPSTFARSAPFLDGSVLSSSLLGIGIAKILATCALTEPTSTYICPSSSYVNNLVPYIEILHLALCCLLLHNTANIVETYGHWNSSPRERPFVEGIGYVFIVSLGIRRSDFVNSFGFRLPLRSYPWVALWHL